MNEAGCVVSKEEVACLMQRFDKDGSGDLTFDEFLVGIRGFLSPTRQAVVDKAFAKFDKDGSGEIGTNDLKGIYNVSHHPKFKSGEMSEDQIFSEFL